MTDTEQAFNEAVENVKKLSKQPTNDELLKLYALYKQATVGDCNTDKPGMLDFKGKVKWEAWDAKKGMTQQQAKEEYIQLVKELVEKYK